MMLWVDVCKHPHDAAECNTPPPPAHLCVVNVLAQRLQLVVGVVNLNRAEQGASRRGSIILALPLLLLPPPLLHYRVPSFSPQNRPLPTLSSPPA